MEPMNSKRKPRPIRPSPSLDSTLCLKARLFPSGVGGFQISSLPSGIISGAGGPQMKMTTTPSSSQLRCRGPVDVLVEPAGVRARVAPPGAVWILDAALHNVGAVGIVVSSFTRIRARDHVTPVGPRAVRERPHRADV